MSSIELTVERVLQTMKAEIPEPLYSEVYRILAEYRITAGLIAEGQYTE